MKISVGGPREIIKKDEEKEERKGRRNGEGERGGGRRKGREEGGAELPRTQNQKRGILVSSRPACAKMACKPTKKVLPFKLRTFLETAGKTWHCLLYIEDINSFHTPTPPTPEVERFRSKTMPSCNILGPFSRFKDITSFPLALKHSC